MEFLTALAVDQHIAVVWKSRPGHRRSPHASGPRPAARDEGLARIVPDWEATAHPEPEYAFDQELQWQPLLVAWLARRRISPSTFVALCPEAAPAAGPAIPAIEVLSPTLQLVRAQTLLLKSPLGKAFLALQP